MQKRRLGNLEVSALGLGCMGLSHAYGPAVDKQHGISLIRAAFDRGVTFFDTAEAYGPFTNEELLGEALAPIRDRVVIATKVFNPMGDDPNQRGLSRKHIRHAIDESLKRLGTDYIDLYQIHRFDYDTPIEETLEALDEVVTAGKALYLGGSSMFAWQFAKMLYEADRLGARRFVTMQNHYNLIYREEEREMNPLCREEGIGILPWSPLARGFLAGNRSKVDRGETLRAKTDDYAQKLYYQDSDFAVVESISAIARKRGIPNAQVALAWILQQPGITSPIVGASKMGHLDDAVAAMSVKLDAEELKALAEPYRPHRILGHS